MSTTARWLLVAGILAMLLSGLAFAVDSGVLNGLDTSVAEWFDAHRTRRRDHEAAGVFGYIGRPVHVLIPAVVLGALLSWRARSLLPVACVTGGVGLGAAVEATLKAVIGRPAVSGLLADYAHSFPSGHVTGTAALFGTIAVCLGGRVAVGAAGAAVLIVAFLALYTGAHTMSDVLGGMALGGAVVALGAAVLAAGSGQAALDAGEHRRHSAQP